MTARFIVGIVALAGVSVCGLRQPCNFWVGRQSKRQPSKRRTVRTARLVSFQIPTTESRI